MNKKTWKVLGAGGLALFMGIGTLCGALIAPMGAAQASVGGGVTNSTTSPLGLDPENDPVVYTTDWGLEIKKSNAKVNQTVTTTTNQGYQYVQDLTSFYYFTMGTYTGRVYYGTDTTSGYDVNEEPINWLIIGQGGFAEKKTPAGIAVNGDNEKQEVMFQNEILKATYNEEIPENCILVLSESLLGQVYFNSSGVINGQIYTAQRDCYIIYGTDPNQQYGNRYRFFGDVAGIAVVQTWNTTNNPGGSLYNYINSLFSKDKNGAILSNNLSFSQEFANRIQPQQLYTAYYNYHTYYQENPQTDLDTRYSMFPLASRDEATSIYQNFCVEDYLTTNESRVATLIGSKNSYFWHVRNGMVDSGASNIIAPIRANGEIPTIGLFGVDASLGVRPAFVLKLFN